MKPNTARPPIPSHLLIACEPFGARLSGAAVCAAIARGVLAQGLPEPDLFPLPAPTAVRGDPKSVLDDLEFDVRMRRSRAVLLGAVHLDEGSLTGSLAFEIATRARQAGVPVYAVTARNELSRFDARILDLQVILPARTAPSLTAAGEQLASLI